MEGRETSDRTRKRPWRGDVGQHDEGHPEPSQRPTAPAREVGEDERAGSAGSPIRGSSDDRNHSIRWRNAQASASSDPSSSVVDSVNPILGLDFGRGGPVVFPSSGALVVTNPNAAVFVPQPPPPLNPWQLRLQQELLLAAAAAATAQASSNLQQRASASSGFRPASSIGYPYLSGSYGALFPASSTPLPGGGATSVGIPNLGLGLPYSLSVLSTPTATALPGVLLAGNAGAMNSLGLTVAPAARQWVDPPRMLTQQAGRHLEHLERDQWNASGRSESSRPSQAARPPSEPSAAPSASNRSQYRPRRSATTVTNTTAATTSSSSAAATTTTTAAAAATSSSNPRGRRSSSSFLMACPGDEAAMSRYQCMLRRQIEFFAASEADLRAKAQGRNVKIRLGQVGIRCRHCGLAPPEDRGRGSVYFPAQLASLYQAVQNMSNNHYRDGTCQNAPPQVLEEIAELRRTRPKHSGGRGKRYFSQSAAAMGVVDSEESGLELSNAVPAVATNNADADVGARPPSSSSTTTSDEDPPSSPSSSGDPGPKPHAV